MKPSLALQKEYVSLNKEFANESCYFLTLLYASSSLSGIPKKNFQTPKEVLDYASFCQEKKWLDSDYTVLYPEAILKDISGFPFKMSKNESFGLFGRSHFLPVNFPVEGQKIQIGCMRHKDDKNNTHFVLLDEENEIIFNSLGDVWESWAINFFLLDKRVFVRI